MTAVTLTQVILFCASGLLPKPKSECGATDEHQIARLRESDGADLDTPHSYCIDCIAWHEDADAENTHHASTGHRATWDERQSFAARRTS